MPSSITIDPATAVQKNYSISPLPRDFISPSITSTSPQGQAQILWIGCSDSWITETETLDLAPEETFVHRNLGAVVSNGDLSSQSAIEWAVNVLGVKHVVICGHYDCGLINYDGSEQEKRTQDWYRDMQKLHMANETYLNTSVVEIESEIKDQHLVEVYVLAEVDWLRKQPIVAQAIKERGLQIHAVVFDKKRNASVRLVETEKEKLGKKKPFPSRCGTHECTGSCFRSQLAKDTAF